MDDQKPTNPLAVASLVLSLSPLVLIGLGWGSLAAIVTGLIARKHILQSMGEEGGEPLARIGIIIGVVGLVLALLICSILSIILAIPIIDSIS